MFGAKLEADPVTMPTLLAIYERARNHFRNETVMGNSAPVVRDVVVYALLEHMAGLKKTEYKAMIEDARSHGVTELLDKPEDVPLLLEAVNLINTLLCDYIPPQHSKSVLRETYDMSRKIHTIAEVARRPTGPIGWRLQPDVGRYLEKHKST